MPIRCLTLSCLASLLASTASAQIVLIDQMPEVAAFGSSALSDSNCTFGEPNRSTARAEDFVVAAPVSVHTIEFQGFYPQSAAPIDPETFFIAIHSDASGLPGAVVASPAATITQVPLIQEDSSLYQFTASLTPVLLEPGTYWVEIVENDSSTQVCFSWQASFRDAAHSAAGSAVDLFEAPGAFWNLQSTMDLTIRISGGSVIPVPAAGGAARVVLAALLIAATSLSLAARRRHQG